MESFEILLNSAVDDLPLFTLTMSGSRVDHHSLGGNGRNLGMSLVVGDFCMELCSFGENIRIILDNSWSGAERIN